MRVGYLLCIMLILCISCSQEKNRDAWIDSLLIKRLASEIRERGGFDSKSDQPKLEAAILNDQLLAELERYSFAENVIHVREKLKMEGREKEAEAMMNLIDAMGEAGELQRSQRKVSTDSIIEIRQGIEDGELQSSRELISQLEQILGKHAPPEGINSLAEWLVLSRQNLMRNDMTDAADEVLLLLRAILFHTSNEQEQGDQDSALHLASWSDPDAVKLLLEFGHDPNLLDSNERTALDVAGFTAENELTKEEIESLLIEAGGKRVNPIGVSLAIEFAKDLEEIPN